MNEDRASTLLPNTCVSPEGRFVYGLHRPRFTAANLRADDYLLALGETEEGRPHRNRANFPSGDVREPDADPIFEIPNAFPFRGTSFIGKRWADRTAGEIGRIGIPPRERVSLTRQLMAALPPTEASAETIRRLLFDLPRPLKLALAASASDPADLTVLAESSCAFIFDPQSGRPTGLVFIPNADGGYKPRILDEELFDTVANNPCLPDLYKEVMVLRPGVQGRSEIVGQYRAVDSHVFEYLRRNSYIPWGHYAANMAHDAVRYAVGELTLQDLSGMRHLYYQRTYLRLAEEMQLNHVRRRRSLSVAELETLRRSVLAALQHPAQPPPPFTATLWGWNYGFDYAPNGYRLHASHQQIHQQYALVPATVPAAENGGDAALPAFACGDMVQRFIQDYRRQTGRSFFACYQQAIAANRRMDGHADRPSDLVVHQDDHVLLFVPKAQTSQWELQLMTRHPVGNILEADTATRRSLDAALLAAMRTLTALGATMISVIEYSKRFTIHDNDQHLLYAFLPRLPQSPGAFSEAQLRWINGHYPEDFAQACRNHLIS